MSKKHQSHRKRHWLHGGGIIAAGVLTGAVILGVGMAVWMETAPQREGVRVTPSGDRLQRVPVGDLPVFAASASSWVQAVYLYAAAHPEVLRYVPCFCGCKNIGHRHNEDCYVQARHSDGTITFTSHGAT